MTLICITGIDGGGKTTLARNVARRLTQHGYPAKYMYGRVFPILSRFVMAMGRFFFLAKQNPWIDYHTYTMNKKGKMRNPLLSFGYSTAVWIDFYVQTWLKIFFHLMNHHLVICDRYVFDTVINDLAVHLNYTESQTDKTIARCFRLLPKPSITILIDLPEEVALLRKNDIPDIDFLRDRKFWYSRLKSNPEVIVVDGVRPADVLSDEMTICIIKHQSGKL